MAEKEKKRQLLIAERVEALAMLHLTRRKDLIVRKETQDVGLDLIVSILNGGEGGLRQFGIQLKGAWASIDKSQADKILTPAVRRTTRYAPFPFPVCLFFFTMEKTEGWVSWVIEPVLEKGEATLATRDTADCRPLDKASLEEIVKRVDEWYDFLFSRIVSTKLSR